MSEDQSRTPLQMRIEESARLQRGYAPGTRFAQLLPDGYATTPFVEGDRCYEGHLTEDDVKSGSSYADIRSAVRARLAHMSLADQWSTAKVPLHQEYNAKHLDRRVSSHGLRAFREVRMVVRNLRMNQEAVDAALKRKKGMSLKQFGQVKSMEWMGAAFNSGGKVAA